MLYKGSAPSIVLGAVLGIVFWYAAHHCLRFDHGILVNACGAWQVFMGKPMLVTFGDLPKERVVEKERIVEKRVEVKVPGQWVKPPDPTREQLEQSGMHVIGPFQAETWGQRGRIECKGDKLVGVKNIDWMNVLNPMDEDILSLLCKPKKLSDASGNDNAAIPSSGTVTVITAPYVLTKQNCGGFITMMDPTAKFGVVPNIQVPRDFSCVEEAQRGGFRLLSTEHHKCLRLGNWELPT